MAADCARCVFGARPHPSPSPVWARPVSDIVLSGVQIEKKLDQLDFRHGVVLQELGGDPKLLPRVSEQASSLERRVNKNDDDYQKHVVSPQESSCSIAVSVFVVHGHPSLMRARALPRR